MKATLADLKKSFQPAKFKIDKRQLYNKIKLVKQMKEEGGSTLDNLSEDCFDHVITYLLNKETINGQKPRRRRTTATITIKEDNKTAIVGKKEWLQFKLYVAKH